MRYFLGVDAGGTKTEAVILNEKGEIVGIGRSGPGNYEGIGIEEAKKNWIDAIEKAKGPLKNIEFDFACFGLAGADFPEDFVMLEKEVGDLSIAKEFVVENDAPIALRAGNKEFWGVIIVMGTGNNGYGRSKDGRWYRYFGEGYIFGDWGGASSIVQEMLFSAFRSYDGRGEKTVLEEMVLSFFGEKDYINLAKRLYYNSSEYHRALGLAPLLFEAVKMGDKVAIRIVERIVDETVISAYNLMKKLDLLNEETPVVIAGSIYKGAAWLPEYIQAKLRVYAERCRVVPLKIPPAVGAALIAYEKGGYILTEDMWSYLWDFDYNSAIRS
ncbi:N-acetylglucosamine kinase [Dictyoglomus thermophilum]|uniref:Kinase n=1 Tax=Dictyoglomus thermophilum (strain ATCC 35947 / DSM 3960 / H-6-12) TaxID=309799 RepID=B5YAB3_DICT6|nr:BadF/BadG/BcrA/BcrD ATPase family protein [Dictyoglomus thermophilum]ACI19728.1 putative kinase [Dictyoglomus thermophilum H-6-12]